MNRPSRRLPSNARGAITITEVAAEAGVSIATVSRVLAGLTGVAEEARDRVMRAAARLDYHPNRLARGLRMGRRKVIGVIIPDLQNPFFTGVVHGAESVLYGAGYTLLLWHSDGLAGREQEQLGILRGEGIAGLLLMAGNAPSANYDVLKSWSIPVVAIDRSPGELAADLVCSNNRDGMRQAVKHLLSFGYKGIAMINGPEGINVAMERLGGYQDALRSAHVAIRDALILHSDFRQQGGYEAMSQLLEMAKPPRAVVVANNLMTLGALQAIHERGIRIPEDIAVVCFDDMPWSISLRPPLTAVAQPVEELGRTAAQLLLERLKEPDKIIRQVVLPTRLVVRASCGAGTAVKSVRRTGAQSKKTVEALEK